MSERVIAAKRLLGQHGVRCMRRTGSIDIEKATSTMVGDRPGREIEVVPYHPSAGQRDRMLRAAHAVLTSHGYTVQVMQWKGLYTDGPHVFLVATPPAKTRRARISAAQLEAVQERHRRNWNRAVERGDA